MLQPHPQSDNRLSFSQPITPASLTFSMNSNYIGSPPVIPAAQHPQQSAPLTLSEGASAAGQTSTAPQQSASTQPAVKTPVIHQENDGVPASQSLPVEGSVDPRELYTNVDRGLTNSAAARMTVSYEASEASESASSPALADSFTPPVSDKTISLQH
jgi:hypothetical protein